jgi:protein dopey
LSSADFWKYFSKMFLYLCLFCKSSPAGLSVNGSSPADLERLLLSAISVVLRRDMSLNRRLYSWLCPDHQATYFPKYGLRRVTSALKRLLKEQDGMPPDPIRVSKISLALLDKWEVGGYVVPQLFTPVMQTAFTKSRTGDIGSVRALFDSMDPAVIWAELFRWIEHGRIGMLIWVVDEFNLREEEMLVRHIPQVILHVLCLLRRNLLQGAEWFEVVQKLIRLLPSRAFTWSKGVDLGEDFEDIRVNTFVTEHYHHIQKNMGNDAALPESIQGTYFHRHILNVFRSVGEKALKNVPDYTLPWTTLLRDSAKIVPHLEGFDMTPVLQNFNERLEESEEFLLLGTTIDTSIALEHNHHIQKQSFNNSPLNGISIASTFIHLLWGNLAPERAAHHVESVSHIWSLTVPLSASDVEAHLAHEVESASSSDEDKARTCARFTILWKHAVDRSGTAALLTKPMMLVLRFLKSEEGSAGRTGVERWLSELGNSAHRYLARSQLIAECSISSFRSCLRIVSFDRLYRETTRTLLFR